jgi:hypothetical protein
METTQANGVITAKTRFRTSDGSYFCYDHIEGVLVTVIADGARKGIFTRTDSTASMLARQFHLEEMHNVPDESRLYFPLTERQFKQKLWTILNDVDNTLHYTAL